MAEIQTVWNWMIVGYLFLGGLSAGVFCTTSILRLAGKGGMRSTMTYGAWTATIALGLGLIFLIADVGKPFRALLLWQSFSNFNSWMAIGAWLLLVAFIVFALAAIFSTDKFTKNFSGRTTVLKVLAIIGIPLSIAVAAYTGILLGSSPGIPLWNTWLLPVLFTLSAMDTGLAAVLIFMFVKETDSLAHRVRVILERTVIVLVLLELAVIGIYFAIMNSGNASEQLSVGLILNGSLSIVFWTLVIGIGLVIPFIVDLVMQFISKEKKEKSTLPAKVIPCCSAICTLIGGITLRFVILAAGIHAILLSPAADQALRGLFYFLD